MRLSRLAKALAENYLGQCHRVITMLLFSIFYAFTAKAEEGQKDCVPDLGRALYTANCLPCHGNAGKGDGDMAIVLPTPVSDLTDSAFQEYSDKSILKIITRGRGEMPRFKKLLTNEERAKVVGYLRKLAPVDSDAQKATKDKSK